MASETPLTNFMITDEEKTTENVPTVPTMSQKEFRELSRKMDTIIGLLQPLQHLNKLTGIAEVNANLVNNANRGFQTRPPENRSDPPVRSGPNEVFFKEALNGLEMKVWGRTYDCRGVIKQYGGQWSSEPKCWLVPKDNWESLHKELEEDSSLELKEGA